MLRFAISSLVAAAAVLGGVVPAAAAVRSATGAQPASGAITTAKSATASVPAPAGPGKISCASAKACLAVGSDTVFYGGVVETAPPLAWNGKVWRSVAVPRPKGSPAAELIEDSCKSATSCLVVGDYLTDNAGDTAAYALTWNGTSLKPTPPVPVPAGGSEGGLDAVSCVTARSCVAIGSALTSGGDYVNLVETWNGSKWAVRAVPSPKGVTLYAAGLSCVSVTHCVVIGQTEVQGTSTLGVFADAWNGKSLTAQKVPVPGGAASAVLSDVSCSTATRCVLVGMHLADYGVAPYSFADAWSGSAWTSVKLVPPKGSTTSALWDVSCWSATNCVAVGAAGTGTPSRAEALHYNGKTWSAQAVPAPGKGQSDEFESVSCPSASYCAAIGLTGTANANQKPISGFWNGKGWKLAAA